MRLLGLVLGLWIPTAAWAAGIVVQVRTEGTLLAPEVVQAVVWHALRVRHGAEVQLVPGGTDPREALATTHAATLLLVDVSWHPVVREVAGGVYVAPHLPEVQVQAWQPTGGGFGPVGTWVAVGAPAILGDDAGGWRALPEVALQRATWDAVGALQVPPWGARREELAVPVQVVVDAAFREVHGPDWAQAARARIDAASSLLADAGIGLRVVSVDAWGEAVGASGLPDALASLHGLPWPGPQVALRVGLTHRGARSPTAGLHDVGRAHQPGRDLVVVDHAAPVARMPAWDVAETGVTVAHEVLHALGVPHDAPGDGVMAPSHAGLVWSLSPRACSLARVAAQARVAHWDLVAAVRSLSAAADAWLDTPAEQVAFVFDNLPRLPARDTRAQVEAALRGAPGVVQALPPWLAVRVSDPGSPDAPSDRPAGRRSPAP